MEHTPGPWYESDKDGDYIPINKKLGYEYMEICLVSSELVRAQEANARLIAAAPDLLEACKYAFQNLKPQGNVKKDFSGHNAMAALSRAIAKAEGGKS